ncbi:S-adenosyl-L-methionine-dependent methyltransferase [Dichotomocladium elegans]|nr:S-adenosyl-L-methionine-dependent methyltransferase [Dichotomocladium elegans]
MLKASFGTNFDSPVHDALEEGIEVLDSGCGPATWTLEMAEQYPKSKFHGTDVSPRFPEVVKPANCQFHLQNIVDGAPFPEDTFGFIHQRLLVLGLLTKDWPKAIDGLMRVLKPGGWIELVEVSFVKYSNAGPKCSLLVDAVVAFAKEKGLNPGVAHDVKNLLEQAGAINVVEHEISMPLNHGGKIGELQWEDFREVYTALHSKVAIVHPELADEDVYRNFLAECGEECKENATDLYWVRCYGQKPVGTQDA